MQLNTFWYLFEFEQHRNSVQRLLGIAGWNVSFVYIFREVLYRKTFDWYTRMYRNVIHRTKIVFVHSLRTEQQKSTMFIAFNSTSLFIRSHLEFFVYMLYACMWCFECRTHEMLFVRFVFNAIHCQSHRAIVCCTRVFFDNLCA